MAQCPKCKEQLDFLDVVVTERHLVSYSPENDFFNDREVIEHDIEYWKCPFCYKQLDIEPDEESAAEFLSK
jgi:uncharacterized protein (UPF0212 family)